MQNKKYTDYDLVKNGRTEYTIVIPKGANTDIVTAASEITLFLNKACGLDIVTKYDEEFQHFDKKITKDSKFIILGDTSIDESKYGIDKTALSAQSYIVKTVDSNVFIVGADALGVLYGAYEFLKQTIEFEAYGVDEYYYVKTKNLKLCEINVSDGPDFNYRYPNYGVLRNEQIANRLKINRERDVWIRDEGNFIHNAQEEFLPQDKYYEEHNDWYAIDRKQLCYTARGNEDSLKEMQQIVIERMKELITMYYDRGEYRGSISFTQEDGVTWCSCDACKKVLNDYGTNAASVIKFLKPIAAAVKSFMQEEENVKKWGGVHNIDVVFFAYSKTEDAPITTDKNGNYVPINDDVVCEDNMAVFYAPIYASYNYDFNHSINLQYLDKMKQWQTVCKKMYLWTYSDTFPDYMCPYDTFNSMQSIYKTAKENNAFLFFDQSRFDVVSLTGFDYLKIYLNSKLYWNVDEDYNLLIDNWFENYFKAASKPMRKIFDEYRSWMNHLRETTDVPLTTGVTYIRKSDWPKRILTQWEGYISEAYKSIEYLKQIDTGLYETLYDRICKESIWIRFQIIELHSGDITDSELKERKVSFKQDAERLGFIRWRENDFGNSDLTSKYKEWGILD